MNIKPLTPQRIAKIRALLDDEFRGGVEMSDLVSDLLDVIEAIPPILLGGIPRGGKRAIPVVMLADPDAVDIWPVREQEGESDGLDA